MTGSKAKVVILGGGIGAISTAFNLTSEQAGDRFEVTVLQQGWRLGGKAASGRNLDPGMGARIEEHDRLDTARLVITKPRQKPSWHERIEILRLDRHGFHR